MVTKLEKIKWGKELSILVREAGPLPSIPKEASYFGPKRGLEFIQKSLRDMCLSST
jgi:hypothetical protein